MPNEIKLHPSWIEVLKDEFSKPYFLSLKDFLRKEKSAGHILFPASSRIFAALDETPFDKVKVIILGQDPYHGIGQANGLSFSVNRGVAVPPSLKNIYKEIQTDLGCLPPQHGDLLAWTREGVLLLNAVLTVAAGQAGSHQNKGWEFFTDNIIENLSSKRANLVFLLWGNFARNKKHLIDADKHLILEAAHPSPFSAYNGFLGCQHFSKTNNYLAEHGSDKINWALSE